MQPVVGVHTPVCMLHLKNEGGSLKFKDSLQEHLCDFNNLASTHQEINDF